MSETVIRDVAITGVGGVGGFFGEKLCQLQKDSEALRIFFIARGDHLQAIQNSGLMVNTEDSGELLCKPFLATDDFDSLPPLDLCLVSVKEFDLDHALARLKPKIHSNTLILALLNGFDIYSRVRSFVTSGYVFPACVYVGTHLRSPGQVYQRGGACKILFGRDPAYPHVEPRDLLDIFDRANIKAEWTERIETEIWSKFIFIASYGLVSAAYNKTLGDPRRHFAS